MDDLQLSVDSTWIEDNQHGFNRVIIVEYFTKDALSSRGEDMFKTVGKELRDRIEFKLKEELGLEHKTDYIFGAYDYPVMKNGKWLTAPAYDGLRTKLLLKDEEHFTMFKLHYSN